jgi:hypothetical protein
MANKVEHQTLLRMFGSVAAGNAALSRGFATSSRSSEGKPLRGTITRRRPEPMESSAYVAELPGGAESIAESTPAGFAASDRF